MNRNNDSLNFDHKSHYNDDRDSYIDKNGNYVYTQWVKVGKSYERRVVDIIPLTEENRDIIILLDGSDHDMDLQDRYVAENADYGMENRKQRQADGSQTDGDDDQTFDSDPMESIADPRADVMTTLFPDGTPGNPLVTQDAAETGAARYDLRPSWRREVSGGSPPGGERAYRKGS